MQGIKKAVCNLCVHEAAALCQLQQLLELIHHKAVIFLELKRLLTYFEVTNSYSPSPNPSLCLSVSQLLLCIRYNIGEDKQFMIFFNDFLFK